MKKRKFFYKLTAFMLAAGLAVSTLSPLTVWAAEANTPKEEVVYINLNGDGSVSEVNVVNIFDLTADGRIIDYGHYDSVRNMNTVDPIQYSNDTITVDASKGKLYYEGKLTDTSIPWHIDIHYYLDNKEYPAEELAGKSGALKITVSIRQNTSDQRSFFDSYALQASMTLDTKTCSHITAENATVANVGSNKQLTWTILPGNEADMTVTADVTDFKTDGFSINAIPLSLNIEIDDAELMDQVTELIDAIEQLDDGAGQLHGGADALKDGGSSVSSGAGQLKDGASDLDNGITSFNQGIAAIQAGLDELNSKSDSLMDGSAEIKAVLVQLQTALNGVSAAGGDISELVDASAQIKEGISTLSNGINTAAQNISYEAYKTLIAENGGDIDTLKQSNSNAIDMLTQLDSQLSSLDTAFNTIQKLLASLDQSQLDKINAILSQAGISLDELENLLNTRSMISSLITLLEANNACIEGTEAYLNAASEGLQELASGAEELQQKYTQFDTAINQMADSLQNITYQMAELACAVNELVKAYGYLDDGINEYTSGVAQIAAGYSQVSEGASQLAIGSKSLKSGTDSLYSGTTELLEGIVEFYDATGTLTDGTAKMRQETNGMDTQISDKIDEMINEITGSNAETISFVSDKNTNIQAVQFVIQTASIKIPENTEEPVQEEEESGFLDKLLDLFR